MNTSPKTLAPKVRQRSGARTWSGGVVLVLAIGLLLVAGVLGTTRAQALLQQVQETGQPGYLSLRADQVAPHWQNLTPADRVFWHLEAHLADASKADLALEMRSEGELVTAGNMVVEVTTCSEAFQQENAATAPVCQAEPTVVLAEQPLAEVAQAEAGTVFQLAQLTAAEPRHVLVTLGPAADADAGAMAGTAMNIGVGFHAAGTGAHSPKPSEDHGVQLPVLPTTGADALLLVLVGLGLAGVATGVMLLRRAREENSG